MRQKEEAILTAEVAPQARGHICLISRRLTITGSSVVWIVGICLMDGSSRFKICESNPYPFKIIIELIIICIECRHPPLSYEEVFQKSSPTNCTVYCGGLSNTDDENAIRRAFSSFGRIVDVRFFRDKEQIQ